jgi:hypothetical protein
MAGRLSAVSRGSMAMARRCSASGRSADSRAISSSASAHVGVRLVECRQAGELAAHRADGSGGPRHRLQLGIVTAGGDELRAFQRPRSQPRLQLREPRADLRKAGIGDAHAARLAITVAATSSGLTRDPVATTAAIEIPGQARGDEDMIFQQLHHSAVVGKSKHQAALEPYPVDDPRVEYAMASSSGTIANINETISAGFNFFARSKREGFLSRAAR